MNPKTSTCIVALTENDTVWIGGDSAATSSTQLTERADPKVFMRTDTQGVKWVFGFSGSYRTAQLVRYQLDLPEIKKKDGDLMEFFVTQFISALGVCLSKNGWEGKGDKQVFEGSFIVGLLGKVFTVYNDYQIEERAGNYTAIGCGDQIALGALYASEGQKAEDRIKIALEAAEKFDTDVIRPFHILHT